MSQEIDVAVGPTGTPRRTFRWLQFSLRSALVFMFIAGLIFAWWSHRFRRIEAEDRAIKLLLECPNPLGWDYNPVPLVRAVNHLQSMGKTDAINALRRFVAENPNGGYSSPHQSVELVIPLLFDRMEPEDKFPSGPFPWDENIKEFKLEKSDWNIWMEVDGDLPFHTVVIGGTSGAPGDQTYLIEWADRYGRMRTTPLRPDDDPFLAGEREVERLRRSKDKEEDTHWIKRHIYLQVHAAVKQLIATGAEDADQDLIPYDEETWVRFKEKCRAIGVHWDEHKQAYVANLP